MNEMEPTDTTSMQDDLQMLPGKRLAPLITTILA
jgi:hypothetical protein